MVASISFQQAQTQGGTSGSFTLTFTAVSAAGQERLVALCGVGKNPITSVGFSGVTIDGQSATQVGSYVRSTDTGSNGPIVAFFRAAGTSATSVTVTGTLTSTGFFDVRGALWSLNDAGTLLDTGSSSFNGPPPGGAFTPVTLDLDTATGGVVAAIQLSYASSNTFTTWTGLTERYDGAADTLYSGDWFTVADLNVGSASTPLAVSTTQTANYSPNSALSALAVSFNPAEAGTDGGGGGQQIIDIGDAIDDGTGDPVRVAFDKCNANFTELYTADATFLTTTAAAAAYQPLDGDLTAIAGLTGTNTIYYRSGSAWTAVTVGTGLTFSGGTLSAAGAGAVTMAVQTFTASGTYTPTSSPSAMRYCTIECIGGGGGGGGMGNSSGGSYAAGGGGSGGYSRITLAAAAIGASKAVTIGAAGTAGAAGTGGNGGAGGQSSVGSLCVANGGGGGQGLASAIFAGGAGGNLTGAAGDITTAGNPGINGLQLALNTPNHGGNGGCSFFGGGGRGAVFINGQSSVGSAASANSGSGGGGAAGDNVATARLGGAGGAGYVIITEFL